MESLRAYLNSLTPAAQAKYARKCGTTIGYLRKALCVQPRFDGALVLQLWRHSNGAVRREELRDDIFGELPKKDAA